MRCTTGRFASSFGALLLQQDRLDDDVGGRLADRVAGVALLAEDLDAEVLARPREH